ncbi:MAG: MATE family efflux transporter [Prevotellaceae bacterium]|jgi:putative MATE family efflux protein|nr:MATE family efflux transporter [Prevotellaceae bacterium]
MKDLTKGKEGKVILQYAMPMIIGNIFQQLYNFINTAVVGRYLGYEKMAAVTDSFPVLFAVIAMAIGLTIGGSVVVAQNFGAKNFNQVKRASNTIIIYLFVLGLIFGAIGYFFSDNILRLLDTPEELMEMTTEYLKVMMLGCVAIFGYNGVAAILRGVGDSKTPLYFLIFSTGLNLGLDLLFVLYFKWGLTSIAHATVISNAAAWLLTLFYFNKKNSLLSISFRNLIFDWKIFRRSLSIGLPSGIQQTFVAIGAMALLRIINPFGTAVVSAYGAAGRIDTLISAPAMNFAGALSGFVGQNIGAGLYGRLKRGLKSTLLMSGSVCVALTIVAILWGSDIMRLFVSDDGTNTAVVNEIIEIGRQYLIIICSFYILFSTMFVMNGFLRGAGAVIIPMLTTLMSLWLVRIPVAVFLSEKMGIAGIWWAIPIAWSVGLAGSYIYYRTEKWKKKAVVKERQVPQESVQNPDADKDFTARL